MITLENYEKPEMEIVLIENDVVTASNVGGGSHGGDVDSIDPGNRDWWRL